MMWRKMIPVLLLVLLVAAACGGGGDSQPSGQSAGAPTLSETLTVDDEFSGVTITVNYPSGWATMGESGFIILANSQATLDAVLSAEGPVSMGEGQSIVQIFQFPGFLLDEGADAAAALQFAVGDVTEQGGSVGESSPFTAGENSGVKASVTGPEGSGFAYVIQVGSDFFVVAAVSDNPGGLEATSDAIAASLRVASTGADG